MEFHQVKKDCGLLRGFDDTSRFIFIHSHHVIYMYNDDIIATTEYGYKFPSVLHKDNIFTTQFHPEKSHRFGIKFFQNFVEKR